MQAEKETYRNFFRRTDSLAVSAGINVQELPALLGISRASLFAYRSGKRPITGKAWRKLEAAERAAGLAAASEESSGRMVLHARRSASPAADQRTSGDEFAGLPPELRQAAEVVAAVVGARLEARFKRLEEALLRAAKVK